MLVAVDWGTTSLRAALLDDDGRVLDERSAPRGILSVQPGGFPRTLQETCGDWMATDRLCLISGMAGSRQGWAEAPYCPAPADAAGLAAHVHWVERGRIAIVPGVSCEHDGMPDVMRGEEVQVFGALDLLATRDLDAVLPGTHSKRVRVRGGCIEDFSTAMTGEVYALLRHHSILARTLPAQDDAFDPSAFLAGIDRTRAGDGLLRTAFGVRTLSLFDRMPAVALASYLSGLVIGEELRPLPPGDIAVIGSESLTLRYALALSHLGSQVRRLGPEATWHGLWSVARSLERA